MADAALFLPPVSNGGEANDLALQIFLQSIVVGITGMDGTLVRPRWQSVVPNQPDTTTDWAAIGVFSRERETFAFEGHTPGTVAQPSSNFVLRHQLLNIRASFYGPNAESNAELLAMGLALSTNRAALQQAGYGLVEVGSGLTVPMLVNSQWVYGTDLPLTIRRSQRYTYQVEEFNALSVDIHIDTPIATYHVGSLFEAQSGGDTYLADVTGRLLTLDGKLLTLGIVDFNPLLTGNYVGTSNGVVTLNNKAVVLEAQL